MSENTFITYNFIPNDNSSISSIGVPISTYATTTSAFDNTPRCIEKTNGALIAADDIITTADLKNNLSLLFELIFEYYCAHEPEQKASYETILRLNNFDFRATVLQIEMNRAKI